METTLDDLIQMLEEVRDAVGGDAAVRLMTQPNYPLESRLFGVTTNEVTEDEPEKKIVYLLEGSQLGYGSRRAWDVAMRS